MDEAVALSIFPEGTAAHQPDEVRVRVAQGSEQCQLSQPGPGSCPASPTSTQSAAGVACNIAESRVADSSQTSESLPCSTAVDREGDSLGAKSRASSDTGTAASDGSEDGESSISYGEALGPQEQTRLEYQAALQQQRKLAQLLLERDKPGQALEQLEGLLAAAPNDCDLLCLRGKCLGARGNHAGAFACLASALSLDPLHFESRLACGTLYKACGLLSEAVEACLQAHALRPHHQGCAQASAVALTDLGTKLKLAGNWKEGLSKYHEALAVCPQYAPAHYNIGVIYNEAQEVEKALECYRKAISFQPCYSEAHCNVGLILKNQNKLEEAVAAYETALSAAPDYPMVRNNLSTALTELGTQTKLQGDMDAAIKLYERALSYDSKSANALYNLGVAFGESGQYEKAVFMYETATHHNPQCAEAFHNLGGIHRELGHMDRALQCYTAALQIRPNFPQGLNDLAVLYIAQGKAKEALQMLQAALLACPTYAEAYNNLGVLQRDVGAIQDALAAYDKCLELLPESRNAGQNKLLALNYILTGDDEKVCQAHLAWGRQFQSQFKPLPPLDPDMLDCDPDRRLVVGYLSPDLFTHSVSYFAEAPLSHHNRSAIRHIVYNCTPKGDSKTMRLKAAVAAAGGQWREAAHLAEPDLAQLVRRDGVDVLVELTGHTANNRLGVLAMHPAPVQVTWIGYPNSTGLEAADYRITDEVSDPLDTRQTYSEQLLRLPGCFLCYTPAIDAPPVAPLPAAAHSFITFGSFNNLAKITPQVVRVWARILRKLPTARLLLKNKPFACSGARAHFLAQLQAHGIPEQRVDLLPLAPANADHLATYALMDISLDPWPYAGTTTTCESLYMGVPCVSLRGAGHAHNVGASLLTAVGLADDWVAETEDQYVELTLAAAANIKGLAALRSGLRQRMLDSPLCDAKAFVAGLEEAYRDMWRRWCKSAAAEEPSTSPEEHRQTSPRVAC